MGTKVVDVIKYLGACFARLWSNVQLAKMTWKLAVSYFLVNEE